MLKFKRKFRRLKVKVKSSQHTKNFIYRTVWKKMTLYQHCSLYLFCYYHILSYSLGSIFYQYMVAFLFNTVIYVFLLLGLCILIVRLPWLKFFCAFSSVVRQMPGYNLPRWGMAHTLPKFLCCSMYCCSVSFCVLLVRKDGFGSLVVSMLASGTQVCGFKPGRSRWIFRT